MQTDAADGRRYPAAKKPPGCRVDDEDDIAGFVQWWGITRPEDNLERGTK